jgi:hypothetical protein
MGGAGEFYPVQGSIEYRSAGYAVKLFLVPPLANSQFVRVYDIAVGSRGCPDPIDVDCCCAEVAVPENYSFSHDNGTWQV